MNFHDCWFIFQWFKIWKCKEWKQCCDAITICTTCKTLLETNSLYLFNVGYQYSKLQNYFICPLIWGEIHVDIHVIYIQIITKSHRRINWVFCIKLIPIITYTRLVILKWNGKSRRIRLSIYIHWSKRFFPSRFQYFTHQVNERLLKFYLTATRTPYTCN